MENKENVRFIDSQCAVVITITIIIVTIISMTAWILINGFSWITLIVSGALMIIVKIIEYKLNGGKTNGKQRTN